MERPCPGGRRGVGRVPSLQGPRRGGPDSRDRPARGLDSRRRRSGRDAGAGAGGARTGPAPGQRDAAARWCRDGCPARGAGDRGARGPVGHHRGTGAPPRPPRCDRCRAGRRTGGREATRLHRAGARARGEHDRLEGQRCRHRPRGRGDEGRAREDSRAVGEPRVTPLVVVLSSPSGGGKSSIAKRLLAEREDSGYSVSATTREPRPGEVDGEAYYFLSADEFERRVQAGDFLEHAEYNGHRYGTLFDEVRRVTHTGRHVLLDIEVVGARLVRERFPDAVLVFVVPPSGAVLAERLRGRGTEAEQVVAGRLQKALDELAAAVAYDYVVVNDALDEAVRIVHAILDAEARRTSRQRDVAVLLDRLRAEVAAELARSTAHR
ncbi:MAG: guanylate kinase [Gemmatimonadetes bacterium]|nr:guanylate kinase [Gemmatimonadota bacterium]